MPSAYCGECGWQYRVDEDGDETGDLSRAMIDHFVETGHSPVERCDAADPPATEPGESSSGSDERAREPSKNQ